MNKEEIINLIDSLNISKKEVTILSSGALVIRGIIDTAGDLDIAVTETGFKELNKYFNLIPKENGWYKVSDNIDCIQDDMINKKELVDGYYLQDINMYLEHMETSKKEKYKSRITIVKEYIKNKK